MNSTPDEWGKFERLNLCPRLDPEVLDTMCPAGNLPLWDDQALVDVEDEFEASDISEGKRFMTRMCSIALVTHEEMTSSQLWSCSFKNGWVWASKENQTMI